VVAQLVEDLVHLERRGQRLDQHRRLDGAARKVHARLGLVEHVVPQARFQVALDLRKIEVRAAALRDELLGVVEEEKAEVEERGRDRVAIDQHVLFEKMPAARAHDEGRRSSRSACSTCRRRS
jgi:hypothetical protein